MAKLSGIYKPPTLLSYPEILPLSEIPEIKGRAVYLIKDYSKNGLSVIVDRSDDIRIIAGDWDGNFIGNNSNHKFWPDFLWFMEYCPKIITILKTISVPKMQLYFSGLMLVDIRISLNKFTGPGMLKDLFGKIIKTQDIISVKPITEELYQELINGKYQSLIVKTSVFKTVIRGKKMLPLYGVFQK